MRNHVVARGETLGGIAARYGTTWRDLAAANGLRDADMIRIGQQLQVPGRGGRAAPLGNAITSPSRPASNRAASPPTPPPRPAPGREGPISLFLSKLMEHGDQQAKADFEAGKRVVVALRVLTNHVQNQIGKFDDKIAVMRKTADGTVSIKTSDGCTEPAGVYAHGRKRAVAGSDTNMNGDGKMDLGRLVLGCDRYRKREAPFLKRVAFRATKTQTVERDTNQDGNFDARDSNRIDTKGAKRSVLIHVGDKGEYTGSAACQTIKSSQYSSFLAAISISTQPEFSYVLCRR